MTDIVERLRDIGKQYPFKEGVGPLCSDAADEIERLLLAIIAAIKDIEFDDVSEANDKLLAALKEKE